MQQHCVTTLAGGAAALLPHARIRAQQVQFSATSTNITCPTCQMVTSTSLGFTQKNYRTFTLTLHKCQLQQFYSMIAWFAAMPISAAGAQLRRRRSADVILCSADPPSTAADNTDLSHVMKHYLKQLLLFR